MRSLRLLRAVLAVGQKDLARRAGLSVRELARIEAGAANPQGDTWRALDQAVFAIVAERLRAEGGRA